MPKGHKLVDWSQPGNDTRLLLSIVQTHAVDYEKVAGLFGAPKSAITTRISTLRKKAGGSPLPKAAMSAVRPPPSKAKNGVSKGKDKQTHQSVEETSAFDDIDAQNHRTPSPESDNATMDKTIGGRITKGRSSPRKASKIDYSKLDDPYSSDAMEKESTIKKHDGEGADSEDENYDNARELMTPGVKIEAEDMGI